MQVRFHSPDSPGAGPSYATDRRANQSRGHGAQMPKNALGSLVPAVLQKVRGPLPIHG